jgi:hypothetical protein
VECEGAADEAVLKNSTKKKFPQKILIVGTIKKISIGNINASNGTCVKQVMSDVVVTEGRIGKNIVFQIQPSDFFRVSLKFYFLDDI